MTFSCRVSSMYRHSLNITRPIDKNICNFTNKKDTAWPHIYISEKYHFQHSMCVVTTKLHLFPNYGWNGIISWNCNYGHLKVGRWWGLGRLSNPDNKAYNFSKSDPCVDYVTLYVKLKVLLVHLKLIVDLST